MMQMKLRSVAGVTKGLTVNGHNNQGLAQSFCLPAVADYILRKAHYSQKRLIIELNFRTQKPIEC